VDTQPATCNPTRSATVPRCLAERPLREWPIGERPIERLASCGSAALSDTELIAALLSGNAGGTNPVALAQHLTDLAVLEQLLTSVRSATTLDDVHLVYAPTTPNARG
jgi:hypothetical protein